MTDAEVTVPSSPSESDGASRRQDRDRAFILSVIVMLITLVPYVIGATMANGRRFMWLGHNLDDSCVYLSWMRQAADGAFVGYDLFTVDPQHGMLLNPLFLVLGKIAGLTHIPMIGIYQGSRLIFGLGLLTLVWRTLEMLVSDRRARWLGFLFVCLSSGFGWLPVWWNTPPLLTPIDKWQPEAITFLSLYLSPLFCLSMALQVAILFLLFVGERTRTLRPAVFAGVLGFVLGLTHSYDIVSLSAVWMLNLIALSIARRSVPKPDTVLRTLVAGVIALPSVLIMYFQYKSETVFHARADVATLSPPLAWVILGYGMVLLLALLGTYMLRKPATIQVDSTHNWSTGLDATVLMVSWMVANIAISYLPGAAFQRKMLQGAHFPIAFLAGIGASWIYTRYRLSRFPMAFALYAIGLSLILSITNVRFMQRDVEDFAANITQTHQQRPFLEAGEINALQWVGAHSSPADAIQPLPWLTGIETAEGHLQVAPTDMSLACFTPGMIRRRVYCGHWGETPNYPAKLQELMRFEQQRMTEDERKALLRKMKIRYLIYSQKQPNDDMVDRLMPIFRGQLPLPDYLSLVYTNATADVYEVVPSKLDPIKEH